MTGALVTTLWMSHLARRWTGVISLCMFSARCNSSCDHLSGPWRLFMSNLPRLLLKPKPQLRTTMSNTGTESSLWSLTFWISLNLWRWERGHEQTVITVLIRDHSVSELELFYLFVALYWRIKRPRAVLNNVKLLHCLVTRSGAATQNPNQVFMSGNVGLLLEIISTHSTLPLPLIDAFKLLSLGMFLFLNIDLLLAVTSVKSTLLWFFLAIGTFKVLWLFPLDCCCFGIQKR